MGDVPDGIDADGVTEWMRGHVPSVAPPLRFEVVAGGRSNLTYIVSDGAGQRWVLRRPPLHGVLQSAHDVGREHRIMRALASSPVPVPRMIEYEPDVAVTGAPFFVMDFVDGLVVRDADAARGVDPAVRRVAGESLVDVLVALHQVDPDAVGLGELGRKEGYIERQLRRWHGQLEQSRTRELPALDEVHARLVARVPEQGPATIVHGDYRLDNVIIGEDGDVRAVLDWELCTLGDAMADVGMLAVYWADPGDETIPLISAPTVVDGFPRRTDALERYAQGSGRDLSQLDFYVAFALWKIAIILEGVYSRSVSGAYGSGTDDSFRAFAEIVTRLGDRALEATEGGA